jgi:hypothetical protein
MLENRLKEKQNPNTTMEPALEQQLKNMPKVDPLEQVKQLRALNNEKAAEEEVGRRQDQQVAPTRKAKNKKRSQTAKKGARTRRKMSEATKAKLRKAQLEIQERKRREKEASGTPPQLKIAEKVSVDEGEISGDPFFREIFEFLGARVSLRPWRLAMTMMGLPPWSKFNIDDREAILARFQELVTDPDFVSREIHRLQRVGSHYSKRKLITSINVLAGFAAWQSIDVED